ncbi:hypothetical protein CEP51_015671 [Fusarium floridanum]|uniref:Uncharacterized protein n=1 Tax=Fusarium floridanum TaxID=1325733 RepID=A0A428P585_9HYPO|nr:hypothetical protein CEP51_015671 [Fusarium floridanum]
MATNVGSETRVAALEQKYIALLERRVAELENRLSSVTVEEQMSKTVTVLSEAKTKEITIENKAPERADVSETKADNNKEEENEPDDNSRYRVVLYTLDPDTGNYVDKQPTAAAKPVKKASKTNLAFTFRKIMRAQTTRTEEIMKYTESEVDVESEPLQRLLARVMQKYGGLGKITQLESPYQNLVWSWNTAEEEASKIDPEDTGDEKQARADLKALMGIISTSSGHAHLDRYFRTKDAMLASRTATFESLWTRFPRGSFIVAIPFMSLPQVFLVQSCEVPDDEADEPFTIIAYSYDWNGSTFNRVPYQFSISPFTDKKNIFELPCYPLVEATDAQNLRDTLIQRGRKYVEYCIAQKGKQTFHYEGLALHQRGGGILNSEPRIDETPAVRDCSSHLKGVVVVDFKSYLDYQSPSAPLLGDMDRYFGHTECSCKDCRESLEHMYKYSWDRASPKKELSNEQLMLLPPRVLGYALAQKRWVQLDVEKLQNPSSADSRNFNDKLILDQDHKDLISRAVKAHGKSNILDHIPGKGRGLAFPGIGVSDIGTKSTKVEENLQKVFALAGLWEAVLLFDEADVFLEARGSRGADMERNSMVSVLLRILEYYDGILVLTTNRLRTFDIAVQSRIHVAIEYGDLTKEQREKIFFEFLDQLNSRKLVEEYEQCVAWVREEGKTKQFNGRQIRNIVSTAMGMAHANGRLLHRGDLLLVAQNTDAFKRALADQEAVFRNNQIRPQYGT